VFLANGYFELDRHAERVDDQVHLRRSTAS
jgi:hypothetical protein